MRINLLRYTQQCKHSTIFTPTVFHPMPRKPQRSTQHCHGSTIFARIRRIQCDADKRAENTPPSSRPRYSIQCQGKHKDTRNNAKASPSSRAYAGFNAMPINLLRYTHRCTHTPPSSRPRYSIQCHGKHKDTRKTATAPLSSRDYAGFNAMPINLLRYTHTHTHRCKHSTIFAPTVFHPMPRKTQRSSARAHWCLHA